MEYYVWKVPNLSDVGRPLDGDLGVLAEPVDVLEVVVLQHAGLHRVVLLPPLGVLLHLLLVPLTLDPLTAGMMIIVAGRGSDSASKISIRMFVITEKAPTRAFSWLKAATTAFTFKRLLRHYAKRALTPLSLNVKLGPRHKSQKGRAGWLA